MSYICRQMSIFMKKERKTNKYYKSKNEKLPMLEEASAQDLYTMVRKGIEPELFEEMIVQTPFSISDFSSYIHISEKTIQRRIKNKSSFTSGESEKILQIYQVTIKGISVFEDPEKFKDWLERSNYSLGGIKPKDLLENSFGIQLVMDELGRIEHGIFA